MDRHNAETYLLAILLLLGAALALIPACAAEIPEPCSSSERRALEADYFSRCAEAGYDAERCKSAALCVRWDAELDGASCTDIEAVCCERFDACL